MAVMRDKGVNLHKRLASGDTVQGYAKGGKVPMVGASSQVTPKQSPLTQARRNNGIVGMKKGGKC
jgi:hypothetical protein